MVNSGVPPMCPALQERDDEAGEEAASYAVLISFSSGNCAESIVRSVVAATGNGWLGGGQRFGQGRRWKSNKLIVRQNSVRVIELLPEV